MILRPILRHPSRTRISRIGQLLRFSSSSKLQKFFIPNADKTVPDALYRDEAQLNLQKYMSQRKQFLDPNSLFVSMPHKDTHNLILENTFEPTQTWDEITTNNRTLAPCPGSIIKYHDTEKDSNRLAVVVRELQSKFNENHNKLIVLTLENELSRVYPQDINFVTYQVFDAAWIVSLDILYHRFAEDYEPRLQLVDILRLFINTTRELQPEVQAELKKIYATIASQNNANATSLLAVTSFIDTQFQSYFHQSAFLMAIHLEMCRDATRWIVLLCLPRRTTNLASLHCSNDIAPDVAYFANLLNNHDAILDFLSYDNTKLEDFDSYLQLLIELPKSFDDLTLELNIWHGKPFLNAFKAMTFALVYPHTMIVNALGKLKAIGTNSVNIGDIERCLEKLGLFNNPKNPLTDVLLSSNTMGKPALDQLVVASPKELKPSQTQLTSARMLPLRELNDKFRHLRSVRNYYLDHIIFMLPSDTKFSSIGVSLEKINARRYLINIHVPDVAARIAPASSLFEEMSKYNFSFRNLKGLIDEELIENIAKNVREELLLRSEPRNNAEYFSVGDLKDNQQSSKSKTCMTITFEYNTFALSPLKDLDNGVSITFDRILPLQVKELSWDLLDDALSGRLETGILDSFRLFNRRKPVEEKESKVHLDERDILDLGFIYNVMKTHFSTRSIRCASEPLPAVFQRSLSRSLSYKTKGEEEFIQTDLSISSTANFMKMKKARFFTGEILTFLDSLVASFCYREAIPVIARGDDLLYPEEGTPSYEGLEKDEVFVSHDNKLLPNYYCNSYYQAIMAKDRDGFVSLPALFIGNNYLGKPYFSTNGSTYLLTKGLPRGRVRISNALSSLEAYLNQLQILSFLSQQNIPSRSYLHLVTQTSHFKALGYPVHGPLSERFMSDQIVKLQDAKLGGDYLVERYNRYWKLKYLEQQLNAQDDDDELPTFSCVVTRMGHDLDLNTKLARCWCNELALEVDLLVHPYSDFTIGSSVTADKVMYLNAVEDTCVMRSKGDY